MAYFEIYLFKCLQSTGDGVLPGNAGLWDQQAAIAWVHDNIGAYGECHLTHKVN